ncbi:hypothetical protein [Azotobacter salinestris]|uniref:hypothetical protein n=1 Tax=Azotobacter salinestris TaxID=69964 RepID=UPI001266A730|nr:hypothetical protein [Azotobacter salinestris]
MTVVPFKRGGSGGEPPHIDQESYALLVETLIGFLELCAEPVYPITPEHRAQLETMRDLTVRLERLAERFTPPKGAA